jgi:hypothetical protein
MLQKSIKQKDPNLKTKIIIIALIGVIGVLSVISVMNFSKSMEKITIEGPVGIVSSNGIVLGGQDKGKYYWNFQMQDTTTKTIYSVHLVTSNSITIATGTKINVTGTQDFTGLTGGTLFASSYTLL